MAGRRQEFDWVTVIATAPFKIFFSFLSTGLSLIRPFAPRLIPLLIFACFIPLILTCSISAGWMVWSSLLVSWEVPLYLQYGDGIPPYAYAPLPKLNSRQRYDIMVDLLVPFTNSNLNLGNFMTSMTLSTSSNKTLAHVRRPAIALRPPFAFSLLNRRSAHVKVPMLESFEADSSKLFASVEIGRRDGWTLLHAGQGRELSVISASLRGLAVPHGIRGLATRFPLLSAVTTAILFSLILSLILGLCLLPLVLRTTTTEHAEDETGLSEASSTSASPKTGGRESRRRRRSLSSREGTEGTSIKTEGPVQAIPSGKITTTRLRRRSSRTAVSSSETEI
ncbi:hypothetical protein BYT27DRAFT_7139033 [Phlegmacium glaucopus]|nr:hypothetical protein BYT27DRAFT_7139033 [Phlegmacium glaucopus]